MPDGRPWPRISIVTPSYNQAEFLEETIRSVLLQGYPELEYMLVDGQSQDGSLQVIQKYAPWLTYWVSETDRGQSHAINKGWQRASGDLLAYLNSDDFYLPGGLARAAQAFANDPQAAVIAGGIAYTDASSALRQTKPPFLRAASPLDLSLLDPGDWFIPQQSSFFVRAALDRAGRCLREDLHFTMDRELMYRLCREGRVTLLPDALAADRSHANSKRIANTLKLYREDAAALAACAWGTPQDLRQRQRVARRRMAQGHTRYAVHVGARMVSLKHMALAAYYNPGILSRAWFYRLVYRLVRPGAN